jgi:hypothetical protein
VADPHGFITANRQIRAAVSSIFVDPESHYLIKRDILDPILHIGRIHYTSNQFQITDRLANGNAALVRIDQSGERNSCTLPMAR